MNGLRLTVSPEPTDDEVAAIVAAVEAHRARQVVVPSGPQHTHGPWRFSGRWWNLPIPVRRDRPWH